jgi:hypothetical protein
MNTTGFVTGHARVFGVRREVRRCPMDVAQHHRVACPVDERAVIRES